MPQHVPHRVSDGVPLLGLSLTDSDAVEPRCNSGGSPYSPVLLVRCSYAIVIVCKIESTFSDGRPNLSTQIFLMQTTAGWGLVRFRDYSE